MKHWSQVVLICLVYPFCEPPCVSDDNTPKVQPSTLAAKPDIPALEKQTNENIAAAQTSIDAMVNVKGSRTVANTLEPFDEAVRHLDNTYNLGRLMEDAHPEQKFREKGSEFVGKADAALNALSINREVYEALTKLDLSKEDTATQYYLQRKLKLFRLAGVDLSEADRAKLKQLRAELAEEISAFGHNLNEDQRSVMATPAELSGLPQDFLQNHKPGSDGKVKITTEPPDYFPVLQYASSNSLRTRLMQAYLNQGYPQNRDVLMKMVRVRYEIAMLLGYSSWADYNAASKMTLNAKNVADFIAQMDVVARSVGTRELRELLEEKRKQEPGATEVGMEEGRYFVERLRRAKYGYDSSEMRSYLTFEAVKQGMLDTAAKMFNVSFQREENAVAWDPGVEVWDVSENGAMVGRVYLDLHSRPGKYGDAENITMVDAKVGRQLPEVALIDNLTTPSESDPGLMEFADAAGLFHEFGHSMHVIISGARRRWAGTNMRILDFDFIEVPSQLFEQFPNLPVVLESFARNYKTKEAVPAKLVKRMNRAAAYGRGIGATRDNVLMGLSFDLYNRNPEGLDPDKLCAEEYVRYGLLKPLPDLHEYASFIHLTDYSSSYYTYTWDQVIVQDFYREFDHEKPFGNGVPARYRETVLEPGGTMSANELVRNFLGRPQNFKAYEVWMNEEFTGAPEFTLEHSPRIEPQRARACPG
jgi:thimet oligopeptidase